MAAPLVFFKPTDLRVAKDTDDRLIVRTVMHGLWLGLPAFAVFIGGVGAQVYATLYGLWNGAFLQAAVTFASLCAFAVFMALFLIGFLNQRLIATRDQVEILSRFGPFVWRRIRFADRAEVARTTRADPEGDSHELEIKGSGLLVRFGSEAEKRNFDLLAERLCEVCRICHRRN